MDQKKGKVYMSVCVGIAQVVEHLTSDMKVLNSNPIKVNSSFNPPLSNMVSVLEYRILRLSPRVLEYLGTSKGSPSLTGDIHTCNAYLVCLQSQQQGCEFELIRVNSAFHPSRVDT